MGVADDDTLEIRIVGIAPDGTETSWQTLKIGLPKAKGNQT
jgi:hypothetical protein